MRKQNLTLRKRLAWQLTLMWHDVRQVWSGRFVCPRKGHAPGVHVENAMESYDVCGRCGHETEAPRSSTSMYA